MARISSVISIHALRVEGDLHLFEFFEHFVKISIHALRVEGDLYFGIIATSRSHFYPRPPGGGRHTKSISNKRQWDFYPRPPGGGRPSASFVTKWALNFYPRPPGGGRREMGELNLPHFGFLSTPSGWRATSKRSRIGCKTAQFLSTPSGWRATCCFEVALYSHIRFLSTPSGWRATPHL